MSLDYNIIVNFFIHFSILHVYSHDFSLESISPLLSKCHKYVYTSMCSKGGRLYEGESAFNIEKLGRVAWGRD